VTCWSARRRGSRTSSPSHSRGEWLEADGLGGFASGTVAGPRTRRYHALLLAATEPPTGRVVLVNGLEAWLERDGTRTALTRQAYAPDVVHPADAAPVVRFEREPWPTWTLALPDGARLEHGLLAVHERAAVVLYWRLIGSGGGTLSVRPLLSGRDYHALHHENSAFRFDAAVDGDRVAWRPYDGIPAVEARANGRYEHAPDWYRRFLYTEERARGLDDVEDLATPGVFHFDLGAGEAFLLLAAEGHRGAEDPAALRAGEQARRARFPTPLDRAADAYFVRRGAGKTIVAGYPWFTDWGRDTFIALRGLALATGRWSDAAAILLEWAGTVSEGMLPNRFPDRGDAPEFNTVDASLWYVVAVHAYLESAPSVGPEARARLEAAVEAILAGHARGTRFGIRADEDGLLAAGVPGVQLTWMDAKVGDWVVTPRIGKPVEIQALWLNALRIGAARAPRWAALAERAAAAFAARFWDEERGMLYDVVDVDHRPGAVDASLRPNQLLAVGGLPFPLLTGERARRVVDVAQRHLLTPLGLRSLAPGEPGYVPRYEGGVLARDGAYHQGTVWPWLLGPFVEAWVRVHGGTQAVKAEARTRFLDPLLSHLDEAGRGHLPEIADGDPPHTPRGCPFQAWSVAEALRLDRVVLAV
jgi:predicted glycogen debranching enzyme